MIHPFFSEFTDAQLERDYQLFRIKELNMILMIGLSLFFINSILLIFFDMNFIFTVYEEGHYFTLYTRIGYVLFIAAVMIALLRTKNPDLSNRLIFIFFLLTAVITIMIQLIRPMGYSSSFTIEVLVSLSFYLVFPIKLKYQFFGGVAYSTANLISLFLGEYDDSRQIMTTMLFLTTNIFGYFVSKYYHKDKRRIFQLFTREHELNHQLETALQDIKSLSGIIPICASCKKIRDDQGYWNQLEEFISSHSHAKFTHSICDDCRDKMLAEGLEEDH